MIIRDKASLESFYDEEVKKELRIVFPNGERGELTNANIVAESLQFTESINSSKEFRFGLCEASKLEFEAIEIENIKGMEIDVSIATTFDLDKYQKRITLPVDDAYRTYDVTEYLKGFSAGKIYVDSNEANIVNFQVYEREGHLTSVISTNSQKQFELNLPAIYYKVDIRVRNAVENNDIVFLKKLMYPCSIPLGRFKVDECERSKTNLSHRVVIAYSIVADNFFKKTKIIERLERKFYYFYKEQGAYKIDTTKYLIGNNLIDGSRYLYDKLSFTENVQIYTGWYQSENGKVRYTIYGYVSQGVLNDNVVRISNITKTKTVLKKEILEKLRFFPKMTYQKGIDTCADEIYMHCIPYIMTNEDNYFFEEGQEYTYINIPTPNFEKESFYVIIPERVYLNYEMNNGIEMDTNIKLSSISGYVYASVLDLSAEKQYIVEYSDPHEIDLKKLLNAWFELKGANGKIDREGRYFVPKQIKDVTHLYPDNYLYPGNNKFPAQSADFVYNKNMYTKAWYSDYYNEKYDIIYARYIDTEGNEQERQVSIRENEQGRVYDLSENEIIKHMKFTPSKILLFLMQFRSEFYDIQYYPASISATGYPWIEAGDVIYVQTDDGGFTTIVMSRTLSGIQSLKDSIES